MTTLIFAQSHEPHTDFSSVETQEEQELRQEVRGHAWETFEGARVVVDQEGSLGDRMEDLGSRGWIGTLTKVDKGGTGLGLASSVIIAQELGGVIPSLAAMRAISGNFVAKPLEEFGTPEQIDSHLRPLLAGKCTSALAITEPDTGSDVANLTTVARRDGDGWILNGAKKHISGAAESEFMLVYAVTDPEASARSRMTAFLVPTASSGVSVRQSSYMGIKGISHAEVDFNEVRLDDAVRLGEIGEGLRVMFFTLAAERVDIAARAVGCAQRAFEEARAFSAQRGKATPIRRFQSVTGRLADMRVSLDAARLLVWRAARLYDDVLATQGAEEANRACDEESSIAKLFAARHSFSICDDAMQILGGLGYEAGTAVEAMFRDCRVFRFGGGTDEIQAHIIQREEYRRLARARSRTTNSN